MKAPILSILSAVGVLVLAGCGAVEKQDARRSTEVDRSPAAIVAMPDDFGNVATKCVGGFRVFVTTNIDDPSSLFVAADPACR